MFKLKTISVFLLSSFLNILAGGIIWYYWQPIASWYQNYRPILGVDFYNLATYVGYLSRHFVLPFNGWKNIWWGGGPLAYDYPTLHAYLILPLLNFFNLPNAVLFYMVVCGFLFFFFSYLLFAEIGKDKILALVLAIASSYSIGYYGSLIWGGGLQYVATQFFLPLVLLFLIKFFKTKNKRWFYLSAFLLGVSFLGHPLVAVSYLIPITLFFLLAHPMHNEKLFSLTRVKRIFRYYLVVVLAGFPYLGSQIGWIPSDIFINIINKFSALIATLVGGVSNISTTSAPVGTVVSTAKSGTEVIAKYNRDQLQRIFTETNDIFFLLLQITAILFILSLVIRRKRSNSVRIIVYMLPALWVILYNLLASYGINVSQGGWYRAFWALPLVLGIAISFAYGEFWASLCERFRILDKKIYYRVGLSIFSGIIVAYGGFILLNRTDATQLIVSVETPGYRQQSSAYPESLSYYIDKEDFNILAKRLTPSWMDPKDTQYRLYDPDQRINIWWNAIFDMPLVKGYVELPPGDSVTGTYYWTSIALTTSSDEDPLVNSWGNPTEIAYNNALFLIDWLSIKYIEAEHERSDTYNHLTSYLLNSEIFSHKEKTMVPGWAQLYEVPLGESLIWHKDVEEYLTYYKVKDELVSPILHTTNAPTLGIIGSLDAYSTLIRSLAAMNLNSKKVIPIRLGQKIDDVSLDSLEDMDAVFLYKYDYSNHGKSWDKLVKYVEKGGRIFIETGSDVKQTDSVNLPGNYPKELPSVFPMSKTQRTQLGTAWEFTDTVSSEMSNIDTTSFGPPVLDNSSWQFSVPASDLRDGAKVILAHKSTPLIVSWDIGQGKAIWSGMNLPYHLTVHKSLEEAKLFSNLLSDIIELKEVKYGDFIQKRLSPNKVTVKGRDAKGVMFRENNNPGWTAKISSQKANKGLRIYKTGPTFFGFSYVKIPQQAQSSFTVSFSYLGEPAIYFWYAVWFLLLLGLIDYIVFGSRIIVPLLTILRNKFHIKIGKWWEKDDEY